MKIVINDEGVANDYGFRIRNAGIDLSRYRNNNVLLYAHNGSRLAIGNVNDIAIEGSQMTANVVFDKEDTDPDVQRLISKYERGIQKGFSMGIMVKRFEHFGEEMLAVESELYEVSCETLQSNKNAVTVKLMNNDAELFKLGYNRNEKIFLHHGKSAKMNKIAIALGLPENSEIATIEQAVVQLKAANIDLVVSAGKQKGVINENNESAFRTLLAADFVAAKTIIDGASSEKIVPSQVTNLSTALEALKVAGGAQTHTQTHPNNRNEWTFEDWQKKDSTGLTQMRMNEPDKFHKLYSAYEANSRK